LEGFIFLSKKMKKIIKIINSYKIIWLVLIPLFLLMFWIICGILFDSRVSFSSIEKEGQNARLINVNGKLLKGQKVRGEFTSPENYMGIMVLKFNSYTKSDYRGEDVLQFKIKEKNSKEWYYLNNYRSGMLEHQLLFPFGFPVVENSRNKTFQFELESLYGNSTNSVDVSSDAPYIFTIHKYPKPEIMGSKIRLLSYLFKKTSISLASMDFLLRSSIYLLPFMFYSFFQIISRNKTTARRKYLVAVILLFILTSSITLKEVYLGETVGLSVLWIFSVFYYNLNSKFNFTMAFLLIFIWVLLTELGLTFYVEKINFWTYLLLIIGVTQLVREIKLNK